MGKPDTLLGQRVGPSVASWQDEDGWYASMTRGSVEVVIVGPYRDRRLAVLALRAYLRKERRPA